ncbi:MAG: response regulator [candidate division Zixibacteria bacterium]|nr:response regulator [candidate division Zixibacteria bacterium]
MKILIAEDDVISRKLLSSNLRKWGYEVIETKDGKEARETIESDDSIHFAVLDWMMPEMAGIDVCRKTRQIENRSYVYIILLTALDSKEDMIKGFEAGVDDYVTKPFDPQVFHSRIMVGERTLELKLSFENKIHELKEALEHVKQLQGLLPICMHCKRIRTDENSWQQMEVYIENHSEAAFSHGICDECMVKYYPELAEKKKHSEVE